MTDGFTYAYVSFQHTDGERENRIEIIDLKSEKRYGQEPLLTIAIKALALFLIVLPVYTAVYVTLHLFRLPCTLVHLSATVTLKQIWTLVRTPFYFVALEFGALYACFKPLEGRVLFGKLESALHDGKSRRQSVQYQKEDSPVGTLVWDFLFSKEHEKTIFAAFCMQPIGSLKDPHVIDHYFLRESSQAV